MRFIAGQNIKLAARDLDVRLDVGRVHDDHILDHVALLLDANDKVCGDDGFLFCERSEADHLAIRRNGLIESFAIDLRRIPEGVQRIAFGLAILDGSKRKQTFARLSPVSLTLHDFATWGVLAHFELPTYQSDARALLMGELYRRGNDWKFRAVGSGYVGGLSQWAGEHGVPIHDESRLATNKRDDLNIRREAARQAVTGILAPAFQRLRELIEQRRSLLSAPLIKRLRDVEFLLEQVLALESDYADGNLGSDFHDLEKSLTSYIPDLLKNYLAIPESQRTTIFPEYSGSAEDIALDQLKIIGDNLRESLRSLAKNRVKNLVIERRFLREKYGGREI